MILQESYYEVPDTFTAVSGDVWKAQSFTVGQDYRLSAVAVYGDAAEDDGDLVIQIRSDATGQPSSTVLGTGTVSKAQIRQESEGWHIVPVTTPFDVSENDVLHIVVHVTAGTFYWRMRQTEPLYADGGPCTSSDAGATWSGPVDSTDRLFQVWSPEFIVSNPSPVFLSPNIAAAPGGLGAAVTLQNIGLFSVGAPSGIDVAHTATLALTDGAGNPICSKTFNDATPFPTNGYSALGSGLGYALSPESPVRVTVTRAGNVSLPEVWIVFTYLRAGNKMCSGMRVAAMSA